MFNVSMLHEASYCSIANGTQPGFGSGYFFWRHFLSR